MTVSKRSILMASYAGFMPESLARAAIRLDDGREVTFVTDGEIVVFPCLLCNAPDHRPRQARFPRGDANTNRWLIAGTLFSAFVGTSISLERAQSVIAHHVTPKQAGEIFSKTKLKLAVYTHIVQPNATEDDLIQATRKAYSGVVEVGADLMVIEVGDRIQVHHPSS